MGYLHPDRMLAEMTAEEILEWEQFNQLCPIDGDREDYRTASINATLANINRDSEKRPEPFGLKDFVIEFTPTWKQQNESGLKSKKQSVEEQKNILYGLVKAAGGTIKQRGKE